MLACPWQALWPVSCLLRGIDDTINTIKFTEPGLPWSLGKTRIGLRHTVAGGFGYTGPDPERWRSTKTELPIGLERLPGLQRPNTGALAREQCAGRKNRRVAGLRQGGERCARRNA